MLAIVMFIFQTGSEDNELHTGSLETIRSQSIMGCNRKRVDKHGVPRVHKILKSVCFMQFIVCCFDPKYHSNYFKLDSPMAMFKGQHGE